MIADSGTSDKGSFELQKGIFIVDLSLYIAEEKTLILSDLHIGYEDALVKQGINMPKFHFKDLVEKIKQIFQILEQENKDVKLVIINGDLKHEFGRISDEEWRNTLKMLDFLGRKCEKILLIQGNHDRILGPIADKRKVTLVDNVILGNILLCHGDKIPEIPPAIKTVIIGHEHAALGLDEGLRRETYKCFLKGKYHQKKRKQDVSLIVMPSLNPLTQGTDLTTEHALSPFLKQDLDNFEVFIVADKVYSFGRIGLLKN